ncbi:enoyl-CoA hydratase [Vibrio zhanjiangensis]|uniref:3-hydroxyisobutyryl-CoA hydrolase n=1 Tax=Vibrio zhanjiangensis TaxID=1046128 RepID=A0ABQ6F3T5_9VIBR|nr:enoyl-CoA hydratase/isomerase family protein [Vibrio zhanjiangensis]GLT19869.1 enoyl-CoA hydratase [Vibrio zhanjiangensis]
MTANVHFEELKCTEESMRIGVATLDNAPSLNALNYDMLEQLKAQLEIWHEDDNIVCVVIEGNGDKAFCAGGDVRTMHDKMCQGSAEDIAAYCTSFFKLEYQCDYLIHTYCKPIIAWGQGIVMGGGMGLFMAASHKIVTPESRLAMPEISIGLYPDVGATWFLNKLDPGVGLFLGLTGAMVNATDALGIRLADHIICADDKQALLSLLKEAHWSEIEDVYQQVTQLLSGLSNKVNGHQPDPQMMPFIEEIQQACQGDSVTKISKGILALSGQTKWLETAKNNHRQGSPITAHLCFRQLTQYHGLSLADCFRLELNLSVRCCLLGEFREGVRARLIDKDNQPKWIYSRVDNVDETTINTLFTSLWDEQEHPLASLGHY